MGQQFKREDTGQLEIPTYLGETKEWTHTTFYSDEEYRIFIESCFKEPGQYNFDETSLIFNEQATNYRENKYYCSAPSKSKDYRKYWDDHKERCRKGVIVRGTQGQVWYLTRDYYMWINFLPILHKEKRIVTFPDIYDGQYHTALYEHIAELNSKHAIILKKRQYAMSYFHMGKLINQIWFEEGITLKLVAYLDDYINLAGSWAFLNEYRDFLNEHTAWFRPFEPDNVGSWQQRTRITLNGRETYKGRKGRLISVTTKQSATKGVGGASRYIIAEESGINPTLDKTFGYAKSALEAGMYITGQFIAYGSVGDLKQCDPLREYMSRPDQNGFLGVDTSLYDDKGTTKRCGLFIPEIWNMLPYSDKYGNSMIKKALEALLAKREQQKLDLAPDAYQLEVSQHPITIEEAFAMREESPFPPHLIQAQMRRINEGVYPFEFVDLYRDENGSIATKRAKRLPISEFPLSKAALPEEKEGCVVVYERPDKDLTPFSTYYASIDPLHTGKTTSSKSLCSIFIYKNPVEVTREVEDGKFETFIEGDKLVAEWCGRLSDIEDVHERCELLLEWYKAWCLIEFNGSFHTYMTGKKKAYYLVPSNQMIFNKDLSATFTPNHPYGWKNVGTIFKTHILPRGIEFLTEELDSEELPNGNKIVRKWGIERLQGSIMLLKEMQQYHDGVNVDRLVAYCALITFAKIQQANRSLLKVKETKVKKEVPKDLYKLKSSAFHTRKQVDGTRRSAFKHMR